MRVLVACEFSGIVRDAFISIGHDAISCDLLPTERRGPHYQGRVEDLLHENWDLMIAHPPCTYLAVSGARWWYRCREQQAEALNFVTTLLDCGIPRIALENPVGLISTKIRKPDQTIQPWQFGHGVTKKTHLWLKNLPLLQPTAEVPGRRPDIHYASPGPDRWRIRSRTFRWIADAMADQWGGLENA